MSRPTVLAKLFLSAAPRPVAVAALLAVLLAACSAGAQTQGSQAGSHDLPPTPSPGSTAHPEASETAVPGGAATATATPPAPGSHGLAPTGPTETARVLRVIDGDTIEVDRGRGAERVRYIGVDTPETVDPRRPVEWMGREASDANRALVDGREVILERDVSETDRYGRLLRYVWLRDETEWRFVNLALVAAGFAQVVTYPPDVRYVDLYLEAQALAREAGLGLWGQGAPTASPSAAVRDGCDAAYPTICLPPPPPDLDCGDVEHRRFAVLPPDPHRFDGDGDGMGCEG